MIQRDDVIEFETHHFSAEASNLGLKPGVWPSALRTELGNGASFLLQSFIERDGETVQAIYKQRHGCIFLHVMND